MTDKTIMLAVVILLSLLVLVILALPTGSAKRAAGRERFAAWGERANTLLP